MTGCTGFPSVASPQGSSLRHDRNVRSPREYNRKDRKTLGLKESRTTTCYAGRSRYIFLPGKDSRATWLGREVGGVCPLWLRQYAALRNADTLS